MLKQNAIPKLHENLPKKPTNVDEMGAYLGGDPTTL